MKWSIRHSAALILGLAATLSAPAFGQSVANFHLNGTIPTHTNLDVQGLDGGNAKTIFSSVTAQEFIDGEVLSTDAIQLRNIVSNSPVFLSITNNGWTLPAGYDATNGPKKADGSDSHFLIQVNTGSLTSASGVIAAEGSYGSSYVAVTNTAGQFLKLGEVSGPSRKGIANGSADIDAKVLIDPVYDMPGAYSVELELTISAQP